MFKNSTGYYFILPSVIILGFTSVYPALYSFILSFYNWNWGTQQDFVGLSNYFFLLGDREFWIVIKNTFFFALCACSIEVTLGILIAIYVDRIKVGAGIIRSLLLIPLMISGIVVSLMSKMMLNKLFGVIPYLMKQIGFSPSFYGTKDTAMWTLIGVDTWWQTAFVFIIILAGLQSIPKEPIEAARIDGVSEWGIIKHIRLPMIRSLIFLVIIFRSIDTLKIFDLVWGATGGGPGLSTEVVQTYAYRTAYGFLQMSKAMTIIVIFSVVVAILTVFYNRMDRKLR
ncbi:sugar ABC transporter permease [Alphaproteobacteria bacterium]|jgi:multiple sugar transport system permease protein|nr:sugar ABC transporter permease [Alphaproteobacteria bacterium]